MSRRLSRRDFFGLLGLGAVGSGAGLVLAQTKQRGRPELGAGVAQKRSPIRPPTRSGGVREIELVAEPIQVDVGGRLYSTWGYNGSFPGPEIRVQEGDLLRVRVRNRLPAPTTVHWHGLPVPNPMDGVPGLTQDPIPPGGEFVYEFLAAPAGSYLYHSHMALQLERGLLGALIVEERTPHVSYDRDYTLILDDLLLSEPVPLRGVGMGRGMGMMGGMMGGVQVPAYDGLLINGRLPTDPPEFPVREGERVRLRFCNPSGATAFRVTVEGHRMEVTHADGRPVEPVPVDQLTIGMGERYDVVVLADRPGLWRIAAAPVEYRAEAAVGVLRYVGTVGRRFSTSSRGLWGGRALRLTDLYGLETAPLGPPDRTLTLALSGGPNGLWTINGQAYPNAEILSIAQGEVVRVVLVNHSMMLHPMHLHGHFFRTGDVLKDTVIVPAHMGRAEFVFLADNPGRWFFHCHNAYHLEAGMAREIRYIG